MKPRTRLCRPTAPTTNRAPARQSVLVGLTVLILVLAAQPSSAATMSISSNALAAADTITPYQLRQAWFSRDKAYHFAISGLGSAGVYGIARRAGAARLPAAILAGVLVGTAGVVREIYDSEDANRLTRSSFSRRDMIWNAAGIAIGISLTDLALGRRTTPPTPVDVP